MKNMLPTTIDDINQHRLTWQHFIESPHYQTSITNWALFMVAMMP
ncbi:hypothetical protein GPLA_3139 [Paraglaciecola polaris LMG 21857]|uniref:Uncharacterized protein n=1 Tax=Paraglaciecola polaris LMG 21857 TaxID=1129793 RepID=K7AFE0_9ALTE|nr:hypothetical protein GPLA_3139 [Paraglaciecola polaris LMG 21857]